MCDFELSFFDVVLICIAVLAIIASPFFEYYWDGGRRLEERYSSRMMVAEILSTRAFS